MDSSKPPLRKSLSAKFLIVAILALAFGLRLWGVGFGLPHLYHADEPIVVNHALAYGTGDLHPHFFNIPPLVSYLLFIGYGLYYLAGTVAGIFPTLRDFEYLFYGNPASFYLIARVIFGVIFGTFSVFLVYRLGRWWRNEREALLPALFLAVNFLHARDSHYIYADIPLVLVLLGGFILMFRLLEPVPESREKKERRFPGWGRHFAVGTMIGLATAVKYNGIFLLIPYVWISLRQLSPRHWFRAWLMAGCAAFLVFVILNPFSVLDVDFFLRELREQSAANQGNFSILHHFRYSLMGAFTSVALLLALAGAVKGLFSRNVYRQAISVFIFGYYAVLCRWGQPYDRYVLPLVPFLCLTLSDMILTVDHVWTRKVKGFTFPRISRKARVTITLLLMVLCFFPPLLKVVCWDVLMSRPDTRTLAGEWIEQNIPSGAKVAIDREFHGPRLRFTPDQLREKLPKATPAQSRRVQALIEVPREPAYELYFTTKDLTPSRFLFAQPAVLRDLEEMKRKGIRWIVTTPAGNPPDDFLLGLENRAVLLAGFSPFKDGRSDAVYDEQILTGGPFLWRDILARERNGYPVFIYELR